VVESSDIVEFAGEITSDELGKPVSRDLTLVELDGGPGQDELNDVDEHAAACWWDPVTVLDVETVLILILPKQLLIIRIMSTQPRKLS